jgi:hypothetical protein
MYLNVHDFEPRISQNLISPLYENTRFCEWDFLSHILELLYSSGTSQLATNKSGFHYY